MVMSCYVVCQEEGLRGEHAGQGEAGETGAAREATCWARGARQAAGRPLSARVRRGSVLGGVAGGKLQLHKPQTTMAACTHWCRRSVVDYSSAPASCHGGLWLMQLQLTWHPISGRHIWGEDWGDD